jgi:beta-lactamase superfamily II metal-dependent hydrolase
VGKLKIAVLNVGHGDFIYSVTPLGDNLVIDCGFGDIVPSSYLSKVSIISELQISHPHTDHFDDLLGIGNKTIKSFICPDLSVFSDDQIGWKEKDKDKIAKLRTMKAQIKPDNNAVSVNGEFSHTVWFPGDVDPNNPNTTSCVTILSYNGFKMLFGGDLPNSGWENLLKKDNFVKALSGVQVFKVPHHGRTEGCSDALFEYIKPMLCIISDKPLDKDNRNTASTDWYTKRTSGAKINGYDGQRKVLTTRNDGSIFIDVADTGAWTVYPNTSWKAD